MSSSAMPDVLPLSGIIPTRNRLEPLRRTMESLGQQDAIPAEIVVVDGSDDDAIERMLADMQTRLQPCRLGYHRAAELGAATQRNQAWRETTQPFIWFLDDDILLEPHCVRRLWEALRDDPGMGGVNAMITNCHYQPPGAFSRRLFAWLNGGAAPSYAGKCLGPAVNLLPADDPSLPEISPVEWMNTTCTMYRREALPDPPFEQFFTGYSLMEDLALSWTVGRQWRLANVRAARIFHDSQPGAHKSNARRLAKMELLNRHFVMTRILGRRGAGDYLRLLGWEAFQLAAIAGQWRNLPQVPGRLLGKLQGMGEIIWRGGHAPS